MACPYFLPLERFHGWEPAAVLPLGDAWSGTCQVQADCSYQPGDPELKESCNFGYARGRCARFPREDGPDAVRFAVRGQDAGEIRLLWVREADHRPFDHGSLAYSIAGDKFNPLPSGPIFEKQARAYIQSYLRRKARARK